jgi:hypothetical protein
VGGAGQEVVADLALEPVVAVEIEQAVLPVQNALVQQRRRLECGHPRVVVGPGEIEVGHGLGRGGEVEAHGTTAYGAYREGNREQHPLVGPAA